jgi:hypothetical protein
MEGAITDENKQPILSGDVFGYVEPKGGWKSTDIPTFSLLPNPLLAKDLLVFLFSNGVAVDGKTVVVGAPGTSYGKFWPNGFPGLTYVFDLK